LGRCGNSASCCICNAWCWKADWVGHMMVRRTSLTNDERVGLAVLLLLLLVMLMLYAPAGVISR
jgi:hypothetical protein